MKHQHASYGFKTISANQLKFFTDDCVCGTFRGTGVFKEKAIENLNEHIRRNSTGPHTPMILQNPSQQHEWRFECTCGHWADCLGMEHAEEWAAQHLQDVAHYEKDTLHALWKEEERQKLELISKSRSFCIGNYWRNSPQRSNPLFDMIAVQEYMVNPCGCDGCSAILERVRRYAR